MRLLTKPKAEIILEVSDDEITRLSHHYPVFTYSEKEQYCLIDSKWVLLLLSSKPEEVMGS